MNGNKLVYKRIKRIVFSDFFVHSDYATNKTIIDKDVKWMLFSDFKVGKRTNEWDEITVEQKIVVAKKSDDSSVAVLKVNSTYEVSAGMTFDYKFRMIGELINSAIGQLQGGWIVKHTNPHLKEFLPQAFFKEKMIADFLKKAVYERWD